jgi:hypothetical protein
VGNAREGAPPSPHSEVYGGRVEVETSLRFTLRIRTRDAARATERAAEIRQDAQEAGQEEGVTVLGLDRLLSQVDPRVEGSDVVLESSLNPLQAYLLWGRISGVVGAGLVALETFRDFFGGMAGGLLERLPIGP